MYIVRRVNPSSLENSWHVFTWPFRNPVWLSLGATSVVFGVIFATWRLNAHLLLGKASKFKSTYVKTIKHVGL